MTQEAQRRHFSRVRIRLRFTFAWEDAGLSYFALYETIDLGAGGALVRRLDGQTALPKQAQRGEVAFNLESREVRCEAEVSRSTPTGVAIRFLGVTAATEDLIVAWVIRQQAQRLSPRRA